MAKARAIIKRLKAIRNIRKITRTMELIATARFKKAAERATEATSYTRKLGEIVADVQASLPEGDGDASHPLLTVHEPVRRQIVLVLTSNRGLCGGYNGGVLRKAAQLLRGGVAPGAQVAVEVAGKRGINFFKFQRQPLTQTFTHFEDRPSFAEADALASRYIRMYLAGELDRLDVVYTKFVSLARQQAVVETLLPIGQLDDAAPKTSDVKAVEKVDYEFLPSPKEILDEIVPASFRAKLFKCFLDAAVSEQVYRMVAMKSATENADGMIRSLKQRYNRARQSQITSELSEIIGGAAALE